MWSTVPDLPRILVVIPTLGDRTGYLEGALASVNAQRGVTTRIVVITPIGATLARKLAHEAGAEIVDDPGRGLSAAVNAGLAVAKDEAGFAWIGDDDRMAPEGLATLHHLLEEAPGAVVAYGGCDYIDDVDRLMTVSRAGQVARWILPWGPNLVPQPASLIRSEAQRACGPYDETLQFAMDLDMFLRLRSQGRFVSTRRSVAAFRWHPDSLTVSNRSRSVGEAEQVKVRHLPSPLRHAAPLWHLPVRWATYAAARGVSRKARALRARRA